METRHNWHKFKKFLDFSPALHRGAALLSFQSKSIYGVVPPTNQEKQKYLDETNLSTDSTESLWEYCRDQYNVDSLVVLKRDLLLKKITEITQNTEEVSYYAQLSQLRDSMEEFAEHEGTKSAYDCMPRFHFFTRIFQSYATELLPDRKIILLGIVDEEENKMEALTLEFRDRNLVSFLDPDWTNFDWKNQKLDFFDPSVGQKFVSWCENRYMLPTYTFFISRAIWEECSRLQELEGERAAWKHFWKMKTIRDQEKEILVEPEPIPLKMMLYWHAIRPRTLFPADNS